MLKVCITLLALCALAEADVKCDHRPVMAHQGVEPKENLFFTMTVQNKGKETHGEYSKDQRYAITLRSTNENHTFVWFMITAEDPDVDDSNYVFRRAPVDVGTLKTVDGDRKSKYSERCANTVENVDNVGKDEVSVDWLSPKTPQAAAKVRIRAMVAENAEAWYVSNLTAILEKDDQQPADSPRRAPIDKCNLCSEARYEVIFRGQWSKLLHPQQFPTNMDKNAYSHMVGASHDHKFTLWARGTDASPGLKLAAETGNVSELEREITEAVGTGENSTRTLIRGRKNAHPHMFNPSHALFRVDSTHHQFSVVIGLQPSPDWFLGVSKYELCSNDDGWLEYEYLPLYPWDAGTMDGVSYNSSTKMTNPRDAVDRVALGSFDRESPFYQLNLNDLKAFAHLETRLLDVYPVKDCSEKSKDEDGQVGNLETTDQDDGMEEPQLLMSRDGCGFTEWEPWSACSPDGRCGYGSQFRVRNRMDWNYNYRSHMNHASYKEERCIANPKKVDTEYQECYVDCY